MSFLSPEFLWLLLAVPLIAGFYLLLLEKRKQAALRYANLEIVKAAIGRGLWWRRHVPPAILLAALGAMLFATARPMAVITLPTHHETVILAIDVSGSMRANDVEPSRIEAAQAAARAFIAQQPRSTRIGVVAFAGSAALVQPPTSNRHDLRAAIDQLQLQHATAVGSGILVSLKAIFPQEEFELPPPGQRRPAKQSLPTAKAVPPGSYAEAAIIGVGTDNGQILNGEGWSMRVRLDEEPLKAIADLTRAEYFYAGSAPDLRKVYETLRAKLVLEKKETEITALFSAIGAAAVLLSATLSLLWFNRIL
jgi:Ca-activated chloride channel family protein